jgi:hypothetical protein
MLLKKRIVIYLASILFSVVLFNNTSFAAGGGHLIDAHMDVNIMDDTHAQTKLAYNVHVLAGTDVIPFTLTTFAGAKVKEISVTSNNTSFEVDYDYSSESLVIAGNIILPEAASEDADLPITIEYTVEDALAKKNDDFKLTVPVVVTSWPPAQAVPGVFKGTANLPASTHVYESFPTAPKVTEQNEGVEASVSLQAVPAFISIKGTTGDPSFFTYNKMVDFSVIILILVGAGIIVIKLRKQNTEESLSA